MTTLRTLECLIAIVDHGSVSAAASALNMSQPAQSYQIAVLEKELGVPVVERMRRAVRVTVAGRASAEQARIALEAATQAVRMGRRVAQAKGGRLRIACVETMTTWLLVPLLRQWRSRQSEVLLELSEFTNSDAMADALDASRCDVAVGPLPSETNAHVEVLGQEEVVVTARVGHRFSQTAGVRIEALSDEPFVHFSPDSGMALWVDQLAADHEVVLDVALRTRSPRTAAQLAAAGMGVTIVPVSALPARPAGLVRRLRPMVKRDVVAMVTAPSDTLLSRFVGDLGRRGLPAWSGPN